MIELSTQLKDFKFVTTLVLVIKEIESEDKTRYDNSIQAQNPEITINESDIDDVFQSTYTIITKNMQKSSRKSSG